MARSLRSAASFEALPMFSMALPKSLPSSTWSPTAATKRPLRVKARAIFDLATAVKAIPRAARKPPQAATMCRGESSSHEISSGLVWSRERACVLQSPSNAFEPRVSFWTNCCLPRSAPVQSSRTARGISRIGGPHIHQSSVVCSRDISLAHGRPIFGE